MSAGKTQLKHINNNNHKTAAVVFPQWSLKGSKQPEKLLWEIKGRRTTTNPQEANTHFQSVPCSIYSNHPLKAELRKTHIMEALHQN